MFTVTSRPTFIGRTRFGSRVKASEWGVLDKILFGTDYPVTMVQETIDHLRRVNDIVEGTPLPKVDPEAIEAIIHCDALALLGLG